MATDTRNAAVHTDDEGRTIARAHDADPAMVRKVIGARRHDNGRGSWRWVRLEDGTLFLGVAPRGALYEQMSEGDAVYPA